MKHFTKEQIAEIQTLDQGRMEYHFSCILQSGFKRGTSSQADARLYEIYEQATGKHLNQNGCKTCQFNNYKEVAQFYNQSKDFWKEEEQAGDEIIEMITEMTEPKPKNKTVKKPRKNAKKEGKQDE